MPILSLTTFNQIWDLSQKTNLKTSDSSCKFTLLKSYMIYGHLSSGVTLILIEVETCDGCFMQLCKAFVCAAD